MEDINGSYLDALAFEFTQRAAVVAADHSEQLAPLTEALLQYDIRSFTASSQEVILLPSPVQEQAPAPGEDRGEQAVMRHYVNRVVELCQEDGVCQELLAEMSKLGAESFVMTPIQFIIRETDGSEADASVPGFVDSFREAMERAGLPDPDLKN